MTVFYTDEISNGEGIQVCFKLLKRWHGSLYKLLWVDLLIYLTVYYGLNLSYRFAMNETQKRTFESFVHFCANSLPGIPISFLLGFYVSGIVSRWFTVYICIPWLNRTALLVATYIDGKDEQIARKIRLTIMRYVNLSWILMMRLISDQAANRFRDLQEEGQKYPYYLPPIWRRTRKPKLCRSDHKPWNIGQRCTTPTHSISVSVSSTPVVVRSTCDCPTPSTRFTFDAFQTVDDFKLVNTLRAMNNDQKIKRTFGHIITEEEINAFQNISTDWYNRAKTEYTPEYWIPIQWAQRMTLKALQEGYIFEAKRAHYILEELMHFRDKMQHLQLFSSIIIPLAYSQVVTIAVHSYFLCQIFAHQFVENPEQPDKNKDFYVPVVSVFSFLFLMGWYKVALCVLNPFGDDDEDLQISDILDYNLEVSYRTVFMNSDSFPEHLTSYITTGCKPEDAPNDLELFLEQADRDLERHVNQQPGVDEIMRYANSCGRTSDAKHKGCCCFAKAQ